MSARLIYYSNYRGHRVFLSAKTHPGCKTRAFIVGDYRIPEKRFRFTCFDSASINEAKQQLVTYVDEQLGTPTGLTKQAFLNFTNP